MQKDQIAEAIKRRYEHPEIHSKPINRPQNGKGWSPEVFEMVRDLAENVEDISDRQISTLLGISRGSVAKMIGNIESISEWTQDDNESSSAASLAALEEHHPGGFTEDPRAEHEYTGPSVVFRAPAFVDTGKRADQSHTIKRPITLATRPFDVAAIISTRGNCYVYLNFLCSR